MKTRTRVGALIVALTAAVAPGNPLAAQTEGQDVHVRNQCRLAAQVLETGHPAPHYGWALEAIDKCEQTGGPALAALWRGAPLEGERLNQLFLASYSLRDSRVTAAAIEAATNGSLPQLVRLNAIRVLAGHAFPEYLLTISDLLRVDPEYTTSRFPRVSHVVVRNGASPVGEGTIRAIITALSGMQSDSDAKVAYAATRTREHLCRQIRLNAAECSAA